MKSLQAFVGGFDALMRRDPEPLPSEEFDWSSVDPQDKAFVALVLMGVDDCCSRMLDNEYRTIARRILARRSTAGPLVSNRFRPRPGVSEGAGSYSVGVMIWRLLPSGSSNAVSVANPWSNGGVACTPLSTRRS